MKKFWNWLFQKAPEVKHLNTNDILLAKVVTRIKAEKISVETKSIPLHSIDLIHPINRESALKKTEDRIKAIKLTGDNIILDGCITKELQAHYLPSVTYIKVIELSPGRYVAWEGNGRLFALKKVFENSSKLSVEVDQYKIRENSSVFKEVLNLMKTNKVIN